jgi:3-oxoadipate enol-lactonase
MKVGANGIEMRCEMSGEGESLVLVHGFGENLNIWYRQVPALARRYRVLTYDVRGFGQTGANKGPYSVGLLAEDLHGLLRILKIDSACVLGFSMGGRIALEFALRYPQATRALILANTGVEDAPRPEMRKHRKIMTSLIQQADIEVISSVMTKGSFSPGFAKSDPATFQRCLHIRMQNDPAEYLTIMRAVDEALDTPVDLGRLECPVLLIAGKDDALMGERMAKRMKAAIEGAELKVLPTGHASAMQAPESFNRTVLDFMDGLEGR